MTIHIDYYWHGAQRMAMVSGNEKNKWCWFIGWGETFVIPQRVWPRPRDWVPDDIQ